MSQAHNRDECRRLSIGNRCDIPDLIEISIGPLLDLGTFRVHYSPEVYPNFLNGWHEKVLARRHESPNHEDAHSLLDSSVYGAAPMQTHGDFVLLNLR